MDPSYTIEQMSDLLAHCRIPEVAAKGARFFCTCDDTSCPFNPSNPAQVEKGASCDACIVKNLRLGEIPSCFFNMVGDSGEWGDFSVRGFIRFCAQHGITAGQ